MPQPFLTSCPSCRHSLIATRLSCRSCGLELSNEFALSPFLSLSEEEQQFLSLFLQTEGNLKEIQQTLNLSYPAVKKRLQALKQHLGLSAPSAPEIEISVKELSVYHSDSPAVKQIKRKLNAKKGKASISLPRGKNFFICYEEYGTGLFASNIPKNRILTWNAFDSAISLLKRKGGRAEKGNAMKARLGEPALSLDSVEGYVAAQAYGVKKGESTLRIISSLSAILEWAGICKNGYGYLELL